MNKFALVLGVLGSACTLVTGAFSPVCGDGFIQSDEQCDDGDDEDGDGCSALCLVEVVSVCGDGVLDATEECDDSNNADGDGCNAICKNEFCGDGATQSDEQCDDGNFAIGDGCDASCQIELCNHDGLVDAGEECDDGNFAIGDGCDASCQIESCGNGLLDAGEVCDDGNNNNGDGCSSVCQLEGCHNGVKGSGEFCYFSQQDVFASGVTDSRLSPLGDFNSDGALDFAVSGFGSGNVQIFLGTGQGDFFPAPSGLLTVVGPVEGALWDLGADGVVDLAIPSLGGNTLGIFSGDDTGAFAGSTLTVGSGPSRVVVARLSGDLLDDLVVTVVGTNEVVIVKQLPSSGFTALQPIGLETNAVPIGAAIADFDGDDFVDIAVALAGTGRVQLLLDNGAGAFVLGDAINVGSFPVHPEAGDIDGDGDVDIVVSHFNTSLPQFTVTYLFNNGDGTFTKQDVTNAAAISNPANGVLVDFDQDGDLDFAAPNAAAGSVVLVRRGANNVLVPEALFNVCAAPSVVEAADLDQDDDPDLVVSCGDNTVVVVRNEGGVMQQPGSRVLSTLAEPIGYHVIGDFSAAPDGKPDVLIASASGVSATLLLQQANGTFVASSVFIGVKQNAIAALGTKIAVANRDAAEVRFIPNVNAPVPVAKALPGIAQSVVFGDADNDTDADLIAAIPSQNKLVVLHNDGSFTFDAGSSLTTGTSPQSVKIGALDGVGGLDIVSADKGSNELSLFLNGSVQRTAVPLPVGCGPVDVEIGDVTGDGDVDLVVACLDANKVQILSPGILGDFVFASEVLTPEPVLPLFVSDLNNDTKLDVLVGNRGNESVSVFLNNGVGSLVSSPILMRVGPQPSSGGLGDLNGDSLLDFVITSATAGKASLFLSQP